MSMISGRPPEMGNGRPHQGDRPNAATSSGNTYPGRIPARTRLRRVPAAWASAYAPCTGRTQWTAIYRCPHCAHHHLGRARTLTQLGGIRTARCGRRVWIVTARVYGAHRTEAAA